MADARSGRRHSVSDPDTRLDALRLQLERTEEELRRQGYEVARCVAHPGSRLGNQLLSEETVLLVLHGRVAIDSEGERLELGAGGRICVPSGVPYTLEAGGESTAYWLQGRRAGWPSGAARNGPGEETDR